jgi:hypothetical protein
MVHVTNPYDVREPAAARDAARRRARRHENPRGASGAHGLPRVHTRVEPRESVGLQQPRTLHGELPRRPGEAAQLECSSSITCERLVFQALNL